VLGECAGKPYCPLDECLICASHFLIHDLVHVAGVVGALEDEDRIVGCAEIVEFLRTRPDLVALNENVRRTVIE